MKIDRERKHRRKEEEGVKQERTPIRREKVSE